MAHNHSERGKAETSVTIFNFFLSLKLMRKVKLSELEVDLDFAEKLGERFIDLFELVIILFVSYLVSGWIFGLIVSADLPRTYAYIGQIACFFTVPLIYYKLIRVELHGAFGR